MGKPLERLTPGDFDAARGYLRIVLANEKVATSSASGILTKAVLAVFGSLEDGAREMSLHGDAPVRAYHLEQLALFLKRRQNPSRVIGEWIVSSATNDLAHVSDGWSRQSIAGEFQRIKVRSVLFSEAEKIVAPRSAWWRKFGI